jgi:hypothetical protein
MKHLVGLFGAGALLLLAAAPNAHAAIAISYSINGGASVTCATDPVSSASILCASALGNPVNTGIGGFSVSVLSATSNSPGTPGLSQQFNSNLIISNNSGATQTIDIFFSSQDFNQPTTPPDVKYLTNISTTVTSGTGTAALESCLGAANGLATSFATFNSTCTSPGSIAQNNTPINYVAGAQSNDVISQLSSLPIPFSMNQKVTITLNNGSNLNVITSAALTPVPEPASIALFGSILAISGFAMRKRFNRGV